MGIEEFKKELLAELVNLGREMDSPIKVEIRNVERVNDVSERIYLSFPEAESSLRLGLGFSVKGLYEEFKHTANLYAVAKTLVKRLLEEKNSLAVVQKLQSEISAEWILQRIKPIVVNKKQNEHLLNDYINKEYLDLLVLFQVVVDRQEDHSKTMLLQKSVAQSFGITMDELEQKVFNPTWMNANFKISEIREVLQKLSPGEFDSSPFIGDMWVVTNNEALYGAASILYPELFKVLAMKDVNKVLYILPSSVHECIAVLLDNYSCPEVETSIVEWLQNMVRTINQCEVSKEEFLSDNIYLYSKELNAIEML